MKENALNWLHNEFKVKKILGISRFSKTVFYPVGLDEGVGVNAEKAKEIIEKLGGPKNFKFRKIQDRHLILRLKNQNINFKKLTELSGKNFEKWAKKNVRA
ncbi:MAG: hypothetical protein M1594_02220 [Candidatus Marsarchaeota archaeon]|nr:hypothetical protein [Candidatus Marsarchaeota archaeon]